MGWSILEEPSSPHHLLDYGETVPFDDFFFVPNIAKRTQAGRQLLSLFFWTYLHYQPPGKYSATKSSCIIQAVTIIDQHFHQNQTHKHSDTSFWCLCWSCPGIHLCHQGRNLITSSTKTAASHQACYGIPKELGWKQQQLVPPRKKIKIKM